jgi:predicted aspartyl protease
MSIPNLSTEKRVIAQGWVDKNGRPCAKIRLGGGYLTEFEKPVLIDTGFNMELAVDYDTFNFLKGADSLVYVKPVTLGNGEKKNADVTKAKVKIRGEWHSINVICIDKSNTGECAIGTKFLDMHDLILHCDIKNGSVELYTFIQ